MGRRPSPTAPSNGSKHDKDALTKSTSISASRTQVQFAMIPSLKSSANMAVCVVGVVKRPSGGIEERAGGVIPHYVGPATLLRHSLPAHSSLPLIFADLIRTSLCCLLMSYSVRGRILYRCASMLRRLRWMWSVEKPVCIFTGRARTLPSAPRRPDQNRFVQSPPFSRFPDCP